MSRSATAATHPAEARAVRGSRRPQPSPRMRHEGHLRLTRRGRIVLVLLIAALTFAALGLARSTSQAATSSSGPATRAVTVVPGQTLWQIARTVAPSDDPRDTVLRIEALNPGLHGPIQAGQQLVVPA